MELMTKEQAVSLHRELWGDIVEYLKSTDEIGELNATDIKRKMLVERGYDVNSIRYNCWLCEFKFQQNGSCYNNCPLYDPKSNNLFCLNGLWREFEIVFYAVLGKRRNNYPDVYNKLIEIAKEIRDLPVVN